MAQKVMYYYQSDYGSIVYNEYYEHVYNHENDLNISFDDVENLYSLLNIELIEIADFMDLPSIIRKALEDVGDADYLYDDDNDFNDFEMEDEDGDEFDFNDL